jgi:hypothetical protein
MTINERLDALEARFAVIERDIALEVALTKAALSKAKPAAAKEPATEKAARDATV